VQCLVVEWIYGTSLLGCDDMAFMPKLSVDNVTQSSSNNGIQEW
jgi:hypothetical protein